jgi:hypothetical protein
MAIRFSCPDCAQLVEVADDAAGMQVRCGNCHSTVRAPSAASPPSRRDSSDVPAIPDLRARSGRRAGVLAWLPLVLSGLAFVAAAIALGVVCFRDPLGSGLKKYDRSTPKAALESQARMEANSDIKALLELNTHIGSKRARERAKTLQVHKEVSHRHYKVLFISFKEDNLTRNEVKVFAKDEETNTWKAAGVSAFELARDDQDLGDQIRRWERLSEKAKDADLDRLDGEK